MRNVIGNLKRYAVSATESRFSELPSFITTPAEGREQELTNVENKLPSWLISFSFSLGVMTFGTRHLNCIRLILHAMSIITRSEHSRIQRLSTRGDLSIDSLMNQGNVARNVHTV